MKKILFIGMHRPNRSPSQRFRFEQYFDFLEDNGFECHLSYLISEKDDKILYRRGQYFSKLRIFISSIRKRLGDLQKAKNYDYIFYLRSFGQIKYYLISASGLIRSLKKILI